jgi:hypothetical protein
MKTKPETIEISTKTSNANTDEIIFTEEDKKECLDNGTVEAHERLFSDSYFEDPYKFFIALYLENQTYKPWTFLSANDITQMLFGVDANSRQKKNVRDAIVAMIEDHVILCDKDYGNESYLVNMVNWRRKPLIPACDKSSSVEKEEKTVVAKPVKEPELDADPVKPNPWDEDNWGEQYSEKKEEVEAEKEVVAKPKKKPNKLYTILDGTNPGHYELIPMNLFLSCMNDNARITTKANRVKLLIYMKKRMFYWGEMYKKYRGKVAVFSQGQAAEAINVHECTAKNHLKWFEDNELLLVARAHVKSNYRESDIDKPTIKRAPNVYSLPKDIWYVNDYIHQPRLKRQNYTISNQGKIKLTAK